MQKLFVIGDSISQGFMSMAAARTDLSYSKLIADMMNVPFKIPTWGNGGLPLNLEDVMRSLSPIAGPDKDLVGLEWLGAAFQVYALKQNTENYYSTGPGNLSFQTPGTTEFYGNVAFRGADVGDAWGVTPSVCKNMLATMKSDFIAKSFYITAAKVLNPSGAPTFDDYSQLDWLHHHVTHGGVENLVIWLGSNNVLGTILDMKVDSATTTPGDGTPHLMTHIQRSQMNWNLWHPIDFKLEYKELINRVNGIMQSNPPGLNWNVFVANVPHVTIAPFLKGFGPQTTVKRPRDGVMKELTYFKYYSFFAAKEELVPLSSMKLVMNTVVQIDDFVDQYNADIDSILTDTNSQYMTGNKFHLININRALDEMAIKRNAGNPSYDFPEYIKWKVPMINTKYYHANRAGILEQGGIFSLDGIHPTAIGHGIIAYEILKRMNAAGVKDLAGNSLSETNLKWEEIYASDDLYNKPIPTMQEIYENAELIQIFSMIRDVLN